MSKKNFKLLIVLIVIILMVVLSYFFLGNKPKAPGDTGGGDNFFSDLLNFGNSGKPTENDDGTPSDVSGYVPPPEQIMEKMKLVKISSMPIAGYAVFNQERFVDVAAPVKEEAPITGEEIPNTNTDREFRPTAPEIELIPILRYVAKENGNIFQTFVDKINERKFSNTLVPGVHEAFFGTNGETVVMRYLKADNTTISTWSGSLPKDVLGSDSAMLGKINGSFLAENITDVSVSPDTKKIFYIYNTNDNRAVGITSDAIGSNKTQIYNGTYTEWLSQWPHYDSVTLTTKPSANVPGFMYSINTNGKDFRKVLGGINGLTTLTSPDTNFTLYSNSNMSLSLLNNTNKEGRVLSIRTMPEKCIWDRNSSFVYCAVPKYINTSYEYPDSWYQGEVSFSDDIWKINVDSGTATLILDPMASSETGNKNTEVIDGIKLSLSTDNKYLFFVNKVDSYLWGLELE